MSGIALETELSKRPVPYDVKKLIHINTDDKRRTQSQNWADEDAPQAIQDPEYDKMNPYEKDIYDILFSIPIFNNSNEKLPYTIRKYIESEGDWEKFIDKYDESKGLSPDEFRTNIWIRQHINLTKRRKTRDFAKYWTNSILEHKKERGKYWQNRRRMKKLRQSKRQMKKLRQSKRQMKKLRQPL